MQTWAVVVAAPGRTITEDAIAVLDDASSDLVPYPTGGHHRWSSADRRVQAAGWSVDAAPGGPDLRWDVDRGALTACSGQLWIDGRAFWPAAGRGGPFEPPPLDGTHGIFTLLHLEADGTGWVTADPLGFGLVYRAEGDGFSVISNRALLAATLVTPRGRRPARDVEGMALQAYTVTMLDDRTGFSAVRVVPQASVVRVGPAGEVHTEVRSAQPWWHGGGEVDLDEALESCIERLLVSIRVHTSGPDPVICELTGGKDSRVVLALLIAAGLEHDVEFRTWGSPDLPDVQVASQLTEAYGLDHRVGNQRLLSRTGKRRRLALRPEDSSWVGRPLDHEAAFRHHLWATSGMLSVWDLHRMTWPPSPSLSLTGFNGEILRTNYPRTSPLASRRQLDLYVTEGRFLFDTAGLLTADAERQALSTVQALLDSAFSEGGDVRDAVDGFYQRGRLRRWSGAREEIELRSRLSPLYDLGAVRTAFAIGSSARRAECVHRGIIDRLVPGLGDFPFAEAGWFAEGAGEPDHLTLSDRIRDEWRHARRRVAARRKRGSGRDSTWPTRSLHSKVGGSADRSRIEDLAATQAALRSMLDLPVGHVTWDVFDRGRTLAALDRIATLPTKMSAELHHAATVAAWLDHGEERAEKFVPRD